MDITEISKETLLGKYKITVSKKDVDLVIDNKAQEISKDAKIPGFRAGKVPLGMIKLRYDGEIKSKLANHFIESVIGKLVKENHFELAERPAVNSLDFKNNGELVFELEFQLLPKIPEIDFTKLKLIKNVAKLSDKEIDKALEDLQKANAELKPMSQDVSVQKDHMIILDIDVFIDKQEIPEGKLQDYKLKMGSKNLIKGFEEGLIGSKVSEEKTLNLKLPDDFYIQKYAGKNVDFVVKIKEISKEELPKLDDKFAEKFKLKDLSELREALKKNIQEQLDKFSKTLMKKELFDKLNSDIDIDLPEKLFQQELEFVTRTSEEEDKSSANNSPILILNQKKTSNDKKKKSSKASDKNKYEQIAQRRVRLGLLMNDMVKKQKISLSQQDLSDAIMTQLGGNSESAALLSKHYKENPEALESLKGQILEDKVVANILKDILIEEKNVTVEELKNLYSKTS